MRRSAARVGLACLTVVALSAPAYAAWSTTSAGAGGTGVADALPAGPAPSSATRLGRDVQVTWPQVSFRSQLLKSRSGGGYELTRNGATVGAPCTDLPATSSAETATCREDGLAPGTYAYRVTPALGAWRGAASAATTVTVPAPSLSLSPTSWTGPSTTFTGALDAFLDSVPLVYRLDDPTTGALLAGSLTSFPTAPSGTAATTVPVACGPSGTSTHTVYVASDVAPAAGAFTASFGNVLCPSTVTGTDAGTARRAEQGDTISITWSRTITPSSVCAGLTNPGSTAAHDNLVVSVVDGGAADDYVQLTAPAPSTLLGLGAPGACGSVSPTLFLGGRDGTITLGTLSLGAKDYVSGASLVFQGTGSNRSTLSLSASTLTITLGARTAGTPLTSSSGGPAGYTPASGITSSAGGLSAQGSMTSGAPLL